MAWSWALASIVILACAELCARAAGLHRPLVYERTRYGYRVVPGQQARLLSRRASYDANGLRSRPFSGPPAPGQVRILCIGDSITNGGLRVDQSATWPALLERVLRERGGNVQVLNASAGGWALDNAAGWLLAHGTFRSQVVILEVGTHDLWQERAPETIVGSHPSFPDRAPISALHAGMTRYVLPRLRPMVIEDPGTTGAEPTVEHIEARLSTLMHMVRLVRDAGARPLILHVEQPHPHEVRTPLINQAKRRLRERALLEGIPYVNPAVAIEAGGAGALFFDPYHPNEAGNRVIALELARYFSGLP